MTYGKEQCPCGHPCCKKWFMTGIGDFVQGSGFTEEEADKILRGLEMVDDTYEDRHGTVWTRPTAWAYFAACRALNHYQPLIRELLKVGKPFVEFATNLRSAPIKMPVTQGSPLAGRQLTVGHFVMLQCALEDLDKPVPTGLDQVHDEEMSAK